ncbi:hypothetical protein GCM10011391_14280 [Pullulanibacillus camelliae]|uniref:HMA domain-containing protein n=1 Tax=Pullulanibacillus camelliae TaxID=1707096 RepID=A0A8J2YCE7_9BACL|nr:heavy metal-associated domain-containing protein [Pullulanibacillus camelliae]GGE36606.1 hypothetical protein GCM10011391_14280 [Pullulanibacillus camelliae]
MTKWIVTGMACLALILTGVFVLDNHPDRSKASGNHATFEGVNLSCANCQAKAEQALSNIIGIEHYTLSPKKQTITVSFDPKVMKADWIEKSLEAAGFQATDIAP